MIKKYILLISGCIVFLEFLKLLVKGIREFLDIRTDDIDIEATL